MVCCDVSFERNAAGGEAGIAVRASVRTAIEFESADGARSHENSGLIQGIIGSKSSKKESFCPKNGAICLGCVRETLIRIG